MPMDGSGDVVCKKCGTLKIARPDSGMLCSECEKKLTASASQVLKKLGKKGKIKLTWMPESG